MQELEIVPGSRKCFHVSAQSLAELWREIAVQVMTNNSKTTRHGLSLQCFPNPSLLMCTNTLSSCWRLLWLMLKHKDSERNPQWHTCAGQTHFNPGPETMANCWHIRKQCNLLKSLEWSWMEKWWTLWSQWSNSSLVWPQVWAVLCCTCSLALKPLLSLTYPLATWYTASVHCSRRCCWLLYLVPRITPPA